MDQGEPREIFKERLFVYLYGKFPKKLYGIAKDMEALFPTVSRMLWFIKRFEHKVSSAVLQNFESTMFVFRTCGRIMKEHPAWPIITVHDGIYTIEKHVEAVGRIAKEEFEKIGIHPKMVVES